jgi:hypothetical protein
MRRAQAIDEQRYNELWSMNLDDLMGIVNRVMAADRVIHGQILGMPWDKPELPSRAQLALTSSACVPARCPVL